MRIYDTFTFFNELELLDIRLHILNNVVDFFVLVEATKTFQNKPKPLHFYNNKKKYKKFLSKIIHVVVEDMPDSDDTRILEAHQRNAISRGLELCRDEDQIIVSDLDEIPNPDKVYDASKITGCKAFRQALYYYFFNCACVELSNLPWSIMCNYNDYDTPQTLRNKVIRSQAIILGGGREPEDINLIDSGGWHFSYLGGIDAIIKKLKAFADPVYNRPEYQDINCISRAIKNGKDLFGRNLSFVQVPLDKRFPEYVLKNKSHFPQFISF